MNNNTKAWQTRHAKLPTMKDYLLNKIDTNERGCWIWKNSKPGTHPIAKFNKKTVRASYASYEEFVGPVDGKLLYHTCDDTRCINWEHLAIKANKVLAYGIEIISERQNGEYIYCYVVPHPLLYNRKEVQRSRIVMTTILGRPLESWEHVHHGEKGKLCDEPDNLTLLTAAEHNKHHKIGKKHTKESKAKISIGAKRAYASGQHPTWGKNKKCGY